MLIEARVHTYNHMDPKKRPQDVPDTPRRPERPGREIPNYPETPAQEEPDRSVPEVPEQPAPQEDFPPPLAHHQACSDAKVRAV